MNKRIWAIALLSLTQSATADSEGLRVKITPTIDSVSVTQGEHHVTISRHQDATNRVNPDYAKTSRDCPPFCIQTMTIAPGVDTVGELEVLEYLRLIGSGDDSIVVIDSRTPEWVANGTIPGSVNIPWTSLTPSAGADPFAISDTLEKQFGVVNQEGLWNFSGVRTLILFCNGPWCGQSSAIIKSLLSFGYPAHKIKWYRGGMQDWEILGLTVLR
ncbi:MAG: rhodanese-related sulfurtransferase [Gammaproteobacteria bacterium]|jgi:rhodanese-related sulfurtransferase